MKQKFYYLLIPLVLILGYFLIAYSLPKYSGQYFVFVILMFADLYLWSALRKQFFSYRKWLKVLITFIYWLPAIMLTGFALGAALLPVVDWNDPFRTYFLGFILVFYTAKLFPVIFLLLADFVRLVNKLFELFKKEKRQEFIEENEGIPRSKFLLYLGYITGGLVLGTMFTGMFKWVYQFRVAVEKLKFSNLPADFNGLKIVQISDLHLGSWTSEKPLEQAVEMINELKPDLVLFTGDLVNFASKEADRFEDTLSKIKSRLGIYTILGNHDYGDYVNWPSPAAKQENMDQLVDLYKRLDWKLLNNENVVLTSPTGNLAIMGVENWGYVDRFPKYGDIQKAMEGTEKADFRLLMTHDPTHWEKIIIPGKYPVDLALSGHTHGFQVGIEIPGLKWSPAKYLFKHWAGLYQDDASSKYLYVNRGLGSIGYPGRIGILPEITLFELTT
jgi:predicted MPP superfamily phosphohydrolase